MSSKMISKMNQRKAAHGKTLPPTELKVIKKTLMPVVNAISTADTTGPLILPSLLAKSSETNTETPRLNCSSPTHLEPIWIFLLPSRPSCTIRSLT